MWPVQCRKGSCRKGSGLESFSNSPIRNWCAFFASELILILSVNTASCPKESVNMIITFGALVGELAVGRPMAGAALGAAAGGAGGWLYDRHEKPH